MYTVPSSVLVRENRFQRIHYCRITVIVVYFDSVRECDFVVV